MGSLGRLYRSSYKLIQFGYPNTPSTTQTNPPGYILTRMSSILIQDIEGISREAVPTTVAVCSPVSLPYSLHIPYVM